MSTEPLAVVHYGLGPIGLAVAEHVARHPRLRSVSAIDVDPGLLGCPLSPLLPPDAVAPGQEPVTIGAGPGALAEGVARGARVVAHCTGSSLAAVMPQLRECIEAGLSVVSTCEELSFPWTNAPAAAAELDRLARDRGVAVLGTGVNPGFAMDYLPVVLAGVSQRVDHVSVHRVQDAGRRRLPLQRKVGAGLSVEEFVARADRGEVRHVGLPESVQAVAAAFGWNLTELTEQIEPVVAETLTSSGLGDIPAGHATGVRQVCVGSVREREVIRLTLEMAVGLPDPRDEIVLDGVPRTHMVIQGGLPGDGATAAIVTNALERVVLAPPGLRVMADIPPPRP
jgi:4-hydroxy-tetrahydrodipicolinate reductase